MPSDPRDRLRPLIAAKWVTVAPGIERSVYGWIARWRETDPLTGKRVNRKEVFPTKAPPGESEPPPEYVRRFREQRKRDGLHGKRARWDVPKRHRRAIFVAPHVPSFASPALSFAAQLRRRLKKANLSPRGAAIFFGVSTNTIARHLTRGSCRARETSNASSRLGMVYPLGSMDLTLSAPLFAGTLVLGMLLLLEVGRRLGLTRQAREGSSAGFGAVEGAVFALFGLLIAFTFSGAANGSTAVSASSPMKPTPSAPRTSRGPARLGGPAGGAPDVSRLSGLAAGGVPQAPRPRRRPGRAQAVRRNPEPHLDAHDGRHPEPRGSSERGDAAQPALNEMFDITTTRTMAARTYPPSIIFYLLFLLGLGCALLAGHGMAGVKTWSWLHAMSLRSSSALRCKSFSISSIRGEA